jgi:hypothetical protein
MSVTKPKKATLSKIKVWAVFDKDHNLVGAHHNKRYLAEMNALLVENSRIVTAYLTFLPPKKWKKK